MNRDAGPCREAGRSGRRAGSRHPAARREGSRAGGGGRTLPAQALVPVGHGLREGDGAAPRVGRRSEPQKRGHASAILGVRRRGDKGITLGIRRSHAGHRMAVVVAMAVANSSNSHAGRFVPPYAVVVQGEEERSGPPRARRTQRATSTAEQDKQDFAGEGRLPAVGHPVGGMPGRVVGPFRQQEKRVGKQRLEPANRDLRCMQGLNCRANAIRWGIQESEGA